MAGGPAYAAAQAANAAKVADDLAQQKASRDARTQADYNYNQQVQQLRQQAPGSISTDSQAYKEVRQEAAQDTEQAYQTGGFSQKGKTNDQYAAARENALVSGSFNYKQNPAVAPKLTTQQQRIATYKGLTPDQYAAQLYGTTLERGSAQEAVVAQREADKASQIYGKQVEYGGQGGFGPTSNPSQAKPTQKVSEQKSNIEAPTIQTFTSIPEKPSGRVGPEIGISQAQLDKTDAVRASLGLPPLEQIANTKVVAPTNDVDRSLAPAIQQGYQSLQVKDSTGKTVATISIKNANKQLNVLSAKYGDISYVPTNQQSTNPELESAILSSLSKNTGGFSGALGAGGSYFTALAAKGVLTSSDFEKINQSVSSFNQQIQGQNAQVRQTNIQSAKSQINDITNTLSQAKAAGVSSINIIGANGQVLGSVNTSDVAQARLQTLKILSKAGGAATLQYNIATKETTNGITTTQITQGYKEDPLSLLVRPILAFGSEIGLQIKEDITHPQRNLLQSSPLVQLLSGRPLEGLGPTPTVSQKVEKTFGAGQEIEKVKSGQYSGLQQFAALTGIVSSVAIPVIAGTNILAKVPEISSISAKIKGTDLQSFTTKFSGAFKEKKLEVHKEQLGNTMGFTQGTEQEISLTSIIPEKIQLTKPVKIGAETFNVRAGEALPPKGVSLTKKIETIGQIGEKSTGTFKQEKRPSNINQDINNAFNKIMETKAEGQLKIKSHALNPESLGYTYGSNIKDININVATKHKGSFTPENLIDTIVHETLHNTLEATAGPEASRALDVFDMSKAFELGIEPTTLEPSFNIPKTPQEKESIAKLFKEKDESLKGTTFEGQTKPKPIFGKVIKEIPNILDITAQKEKSGQAILGQAFVSETQVAFLREPTGLVESKILVSGKVKPEVAATLGLTQVKGEENIFIGSIKTKGQRRYFEEAQKANLITGRLSEIHLQSKIDVSKAPDVYIAISRNPDLIKGNKFPEIVRPEIVGYHESYPTKIQEFAKISKTTRAFKPMKAFEMSKGLRTGAGSQGKAKSILETVKPTETKLLEKPSLFKTEKATQKYELTKGYTPNITRQRQRQQTELETTFLQYPKSSTLTIPLSKGLTEEKTTYTSKLDNLFKTSTKEKTTNIFKLTTTPKSIQSTNITSLFKQETGSKLVSAQISKQLQKTVPDLTSRTPPNETPGRKKIPPFGFPGFKSGGGGGIFAGTGARLGYIGNVPESSIIGQYNRAEISYGGGGYKSKSSTNKTFKMLKGNKSFKL